MYLVLSLAICLQTSLALIEAASFFLIVRVNLLFCKFVSRTEEKRYSGKQEIASYNFLELMFFINLVLKTSRKVANAQSFCFCLLRLNTAYFFLQSLIHFTITSTQSSLSFIHGMCL